MAQYLPIVLMIVVAILFAAGSFIASGLLAPRSSSPEKSAPYECGIIPSQQPPERFPVRFYLVAMIFIVFDVEVIFLYPYVINYQALGAFGLAEMIVFSIAVVACLVFLIAHGALDWGPAKKADADSQRSPSRTAASTIRRVGSEGRDPRDEPQPGKKVAA